MTLLLAVSSLLSRLLGVYRNHVLAGVFGAGELSDAYFAAFQIPDTLYRLLVFGAISASFVPLFLKLKRENAQKAWDFVSSVQNGFLIFVLILAVIIFIFAENFVALLYWQFSPEIQAETSTLLRIMLISPIFFTISGILSGIQNVFRSFWGFALAPIFYNLAIIFGILVLAPSWGIAGVAYGVVLGAFLHAFVQLFPCLKMGFVWKLSLHWSGEFKKLLYTAVPRILSMAGFQLNFFIEGIVATTLLAGNLTVLRYAQDLQSFPIGIIGVSVAISSFSIISNLVIDGDSLRLASYVRDKLDHLFLLMIPAAFGLYALRYPLISLILEGGVFDKAAADLTAVTLMYLCLGLVAAAVSPLITRVFFAYHDTFWPFLVTVLTVLINTVLVIYFAGTMGVAGIGLASSISMSLSLVAMLVILHRKYLKTQKFLNLKNIAIFTTAGGVMSYLISLVMQNISLSGSWIILFIQTTALTILGAIIYMLIGFIFLRKRLFELIKTIGN